MSRFHSARHVAVLLAAPLAFAVVACSPAREPTPVNGTPPKIVDGGLGGTCDAKAAEQFIGQQLDNALGERAKAAAGARGVRVIRPGMAVTMDYRAGRLNIEIDDDRRITRVSCG